VRAAAAAAASLLLLLAGCGGVPGPNAPRAQGGAVVRTASSDPNTPQLIAQRERAGLPDCPVPAAAAEPVSYGLPPVSLPCLGSDRWVTLSDLRGRPMVINLWAQWCDPCRQEAPYLRRFADEAAGKVDVIGIDITDPLPDKAIEFAAASGWRYPHLVDREGLLSRSMQVPGIPVTLLVNAEGRIVYRHTGPFTSAQQVRDLVSEQLGVV